MAMVVINGFEVVNVDHQDRKACALSFESLGLLEKSPAVEKASQRVSACPTDERHQQRQDTDGKNQVLESSCI
jgi:hypothetical protein